MIGAARRSNRVTGRTWFAPNADIVIARTPGGLRAQLSVSLEVAGRVARIEGSAALALATGIVDLSITLPRLDAGMVAMADPILARVGLVHAEIGGRIDMTVDVARGVRAVRVDLATGPGLIVDPAMFPEPVGFAGVRVRAQSTNDLARIDFDLALTDVMGAAVSATGRIDDPLTVPMLTLHGEARNVTADDLKLLWPINAGPGAREWTTANVTDGRVEQATLELVARMPAGLDGRGPGSELAIERLDARMRFTNLTVNYRAPMTPVRGVSGNAQFSQSRAVFEVTSGTALGLRVIRPDRARGDRRARLDRVDRRQHPRAGARRDDRMTAAARLRAQDQPRAGRLRRQHDGAAAGPLSPDPAPDARRDPGPGVGQRRQLPDAPRGARAGHPRRRDQLPGRRPHPAGDRPGTVRAGAGGYRADPELLPSRRS